MRSELWDHHAIQVVRVRDFQTGTQYFADRKAFEDHAFRMDLGSGPQIVLPLAYWVVEKRDRRK